MLSRDQIVERGEIAKQRGIETHSPWIYYAKVKSSNGKTRIAEKQCFNIPHLLGEIVKGHAKNKETLYVYGISRVMRTTMKSIREDI